ncbi:ATP-binding protein [Actinacidiphila glaucinigra]|uniref:ATP-binding protein n=1 Tax=Actinacidiphila glaucinigra TaxID=235986 RepID=UPI0033B2A8FD
MTTTQPKTITTGTSGSPVAVVETPMSVSEDSVWQWRRDFEANRSSGGNARVHTRTQLHIGRWPGDVENAAQIAARLMDNAARHSSPPPRARLGLRLAAIATGEILIEVTDPLPDFPHFTEAVTWQPTEGQRARGLWIAQHLGARLSYAVADDRRSKTVQALVPGTPA